MPSVHEHEACVRFLRAARVDPHCWKRFRWAYYRRELPLEQAVQEFPPSVREAFCTVFFEHALTRVEHSPVAGDGASKLIFRTGRGRLLESVILRRRTGRTTLCLSSQVGCAVNCAFCATARMGLEENLSACEIVDQFVQAKAQLSGEGRRVRNVVFMGMGEPLHNLAAVTEALQLLLGEHGWALPGRRIVVSTVGIPPAMIELARRFPTVRIGVSLHTARPELREQLIPMARRWSLATLRDAIREVARIQSQPVMVAYLMLRGLNDAPADAEALADYLSDLSVHVNLIPMNPIPDAPEFQAPLRERRDAFARRLRARGIVVTIRYSQGTEIAAACGQLVRQQPAQSLRAQS